MFHFCC